MQLYKKINKEIELEYNISEVTSICMDIDYKTNNKEVTGVLNLEGDYVSSNFDSQKEEFKRKIDFNFTIDDNVNTNTIKVEIDDFTYDIDQNKLLINVDLSVNYEISLFEERVEFDKFIESHEIDPNESLNINENVEDISETDVLDSKIIEPKIELTKSSEESTPKLESDDTDIRKVSNNSIEENIMNLANNSENDFITYHIYIVNETDTLDGIADKYHISLDIIKEYNDVDNIKSGMKLVIPITNE